MSDTDRYRQIADDYRACRRLGMSHYAAVKQTAAAYVTTQKTVEIAVAQTPLYPS